ncbi:hypothetical protein BB28_03920 [Mycobacteroides chelonae CCUG 47445]|nr:hypothetical protein BB28_03920 [Mycobacteroides chelonae CCUG 47445]
MTVWNRVTNWSIAHGCRESSGEIRASTGPIIFRIGSYAVAGANASDENTPAAGATSISEASPPCSSGPGAGQPKGQGCATDIGSPRSVTEGSAPNGPAA